MFNGLHAVPYGNYTTKIRVYVYILYIVICLFMCDIYLYTFVAPCGTVVYFVVWYKGQILVPGCASLHATVFCALEDFNCRS